MWVNDGEDPHALAAAILNPPDDARSDTRYVGRARLRSVRLHDGGKGLVRSYRHGGLLRRWSRDWFMGWPPRPLAELLVAEQARRRGVPTPNVAAAVAAYAWGPLYHGWLVTRELCGAEDLWRAVRSKDPARPVTALMARVGKTVRFMHEAGVYHTDLNMRNLLVRGPAQEVFVIDFDKGRLFERPVPQTLRRRNVARLRRSIRKLDPAHRHVSEEDWQGFLIAYHA